MYESKILSPSFLFDDLTNLAQGVDVPDPNGPSYEVEIEVSAAVIREEGLKALASQPHNYVGVVEGLLENYRVLARAADIKPS